ncbi:hypothetical protein E4P43_11725, partial [Blastococcus sp. TF02A-35]
TPRSPGCRSARCGRCPAPPPPPAASAAGERLAPTGSGTPARPATGGGITVPPLPPIPGPVANGRRPLSNEDFEEELDIPEFLKG